MLHILKPAEGCSVFFSGDLSMFDAHNLFDRLKPVLLQKQDVSLQSAAR